MGGCASRAEGCVGGKHLRRSHRTHRRRKLSKRRTSSRGAVEAVSKVHGESDCPQEQVIYSDPTFQASLGSVDEAWFDAVATLESDCEDDFMSVQEDAVSSNGSEGAFISTFSSFREASHGDVNVSVPPRQSVDQQLKEQKPGVLLAEKVGNTGISHADGTLKIFMPTVTHDEVSGIYVDDVATGGEGSLLDHCGILQNHCLPCLTPPATAIEKHQSLSSSPASSRKNAALRHPFKWRSEDGHPIRALFFTKVFLERPLAGWQVPFCRLEKKMLDSWSHIEPCTFKVRGRNYMRDKKKEFAPKCAAYHTFGVDVFLGQRKINHIARFVELPIGNSFSKFPSILVVNVQIPLYPAAIFQSETDGEGMSIVLYSKLSSSFSEEISTHFQDSIRRLINAEVEKVRGFPLDTISPFRERLKILGRVVNVDELPLNAAERKLMHAYNEKPVLSRPQHEFYLGENYLEIDLDMHRFSYISRKGFDTFLDRLKLCVLDIGLTIQGNKPEELPEQILCCARLNGIDYTNYQLLAAT